MTLFRNRLRLLPGVAGVLTLALIVGACKDENKLSVAPSIDPKKLPTLSTKNVLTYISDSGFTKYKIVTPLWNVYSAADESYWDFPEGVYLKQLDHNLKVVATIAADSAKYFNGHRRWELYGNVEIDQKGKTYFATPKIFFDDRNKEIYSDAFIHIETPTQILEGKGFRSNMDLTHYTVLKPTGVFPMDQRQMTPMVSPIMPPSFGNDSIEGPDGAPALDAANSPDSQNPGGNPQPQPQN